MDNTLIGVLYMTTRYALCMLSGGNQRELARQKNAKKQASLAKNKAAADKSGNKGAGLEQRKQRDADIMREKQKKAVEKK